MNLPDPRNKDIMVFVGDGLVPRAEARVSVFDSVVQGGDAVWEGLRVYDGRIAALGGHLERRRWDFAVLEFSEVARTPAPVLAPIGVPIRSVRAAGAVLLAAPDELLPVADGR